MFKIYNIDDDLFVKNHIQIYDNTFPSAFSSYVKKHTTKVTNTLFIVYDNDNIINYCKDLHGYIGFHKVIKDTSYLYFLLFNNVNNASNALFILKKKGLNITYSHNFTKNQIQYKKN